MGAVSAPTVAVRSAVPAGADVYPSATRRRGPAFLSVHRHGHGDFPARLFPGRRGAATQAAVAALLLVTTVTAAGCTGRPPAGPGTSPTASATGDAYQASDAWGQLAGRVAAAQDRRYIASYSLTAKGRPAATLTVTIATDGSWQVVVPGGALGGTATVALARTPAGVYQCPLLPAPSCVLAGPGLPTRSDPHFQHIFTDWLDVLRNRQSAISVDNAKAPAGARGQCFSVEPNAAALAAPLDAGIYCFDADGTLTAATIAAGALVLIGAPVPAPPTVTLPGPVVPGALLGTASPPPSPSPSASPSASASKTP